MRTKSLVALFCVFGLGLLLSSCTPGVYVGGTVGYPAYGGYGYGYGPRYYGGPRYVPAPAPYRGYYHGGYGRGGYGYGHGGYGGRRGGRY